MENPVNNISKSVLTLALCLGLSGAALAQSTESPTPKTAQQPAKAAKATKKTEKQNVEAANSGGSHTVSKPHHDSQDTTAKKPLNGKHEQAMHKPASSTHDMKPVANPSK